MKAKQLHTIIFPIFPIFPTCCSVSVHPLLFCDDATSPRDRWSYSHLNGLCVAAQRFTSVYIRASEVWPSTIHLKYHVGAQTHNNDGRSLVQRRESGTYPVDCYSSHIHKSFHTVWGNEEEKGLCSPAFHAVCQSRDAAQVSPIVTEDGRLAELQVTIPPRTSISWNIRSGFVVTLLSKCFFCMTSSQL